MDNNVNFMADECYSIVGAAMEVHKALGKGFTEYVYQDALEVEFKQRGIPYEREKPVKVYYRRCGAATQLYCRLCVLRRNNCGTKGYQHHLLGS